MNAVQRIAKNTLLLISARLLGAAMNFLFFVAIARYLGAEDFGILSFALALSLIFSVLGDLGLEPLTIREVARQKTLVFKYLGNISVIKLGLSVAVFGLVALAVNLMGYPQLTVRLVYLVALSYILSSFTTMFNSIFQAHEKMEFVSLGSILQSALLLGGGWVGVSQGFGIMYFGLVYVMASVIALGFSLVLCIWRFAVPRPEADWGFWKATMKQALPFGLSMICCAVYAWISSLMLSRMQGDVAVGWYNAAYRLTMALYLIPLSYFAAMYPVMSRLHGSSSTSLRFAYQRSFKYMVVLAVPIAVGTTLLADTFISLIFGSAYAPATIALQIVIWANVFTFMLQSPWYLLNSLGRQVSGTKAVALGATVNVILNFLLIPWLGYTGAAITEVVIEFVILAFLWISLWRFGYGLDGQFPVLALRVAFASLAMAVTIVCARELGLLPVIVLAVLTYLGAMFLAKGVDGEDTRLLMQVIRRPGGNPG